MKKEKWQMMIKEGFFRRHAVKISMFLVLAFLVSFTPQAVQRVAAADISVPSSANVVSGRAFIQIRNTSSSEMVIYDVTAAQPSVSVLLINATIAANGTTILEIETTSAASHAALLSFTYSLAGVVQPVQTASVVLNVGSQNQTPSPSPSPGSALLMLTAPTTILTAIPGQTQTIDLTFTNIGLGAVSGVRFYTTTNEDFVLSLPSGAQNVNFNAGQSQTVRLTLTPRSGIAARNHEIPVNFIYFDASGAAVRGSVDVMVRIDDTARAASFVRVQPANYVTLVAGQTTAVSVTIRNAGNWHATNFDLQLQPIQDITVTRGAGGQVANFAQNTEQTFVLNITPNRNIDPGTTTIPVHFSFTDPVTGNVVNPPPINIMARIEGADEQLPDDRIASVSFADFSVVPATVTAGDTFTVSVTLVNDGDVTVNNLRLLYASSAAGLNLINTMPVRNLGNVAVGQRITTEFTFLANEDMATGSFLTSFTVRYNSELGRDDIVHTSNFPIGVIEAERVVDDEILNRDRAAVRFSNVSRPTSTFGVGDDITISFTLTNTGAHTATGLRVAAETALAPRSAMIVFEDSLAPGASRTFSFTFAATGATATQNHGIQFNVTYSTLIGDGLELTAAAVSDFVGVNVYNPDAEDDTPAGSSVPIIMLNNYNVYPRIVHAGDDFDIYLEFVNTHAYLPVTNMLVTLIAENLHLPNIGDAGSVFAPIDTSNQFFIPSIGPGESVEKFLRMSALPNAPGRNYNMTIRFEFDSTASPARTTLESRFGIPVAQSPRLEVSEVFIPQQMSGGEMHWVNFTIHNTGQTMLRNLRAWFESDGGFETHQANEVYGHFPAGSFHFFDNPITASQFADGPQILRLWVTYDNDMNERIYHYEEWEVMVFGGGGGFDRPGGPGGPGFWPMPDPECPGYPWCDPSDEFNWCPVHSNDLCEGCELCETGGDGIFSNIIGFVGDNRWWFIGGGAVVLIVAAVVVSSVIRRKRDNEFDVD